MAARARMIREWSRLDKRRGRCSGRGTVWAVVRRQSGTDGDLGTITRQWVAERCSHEREVSDRRPARSTRGPGLKRPAPRSGGGADGGL